MSGRHADPGRHAGRPNSWPADILKGWPLVVTVVVTLLMWAAVGAYLLVRVHW